MNSDYVIQVEYDVSKEDMDFFINSFRSYNTSIIGKQESNEIKIVLKTKDDQIVGGATGTAVWGWLMVNYFWLDENLLNNEMYKLLLAQVENQAIKFGVYKISIDTFELNVKQIYENNGYEVEGFLNERPPGYVSYFLKKDVATNQSFSSNRKVQIYTGDAVSEQDIKWINQKIEEEQFKRLGKLLTKEIVIFARDHSSKIIGGLKGYIGWGWLYISTLWVNDSYRSKGLGSELLLKAEELALEHGIPYSFLGTTEFQARGFYEKNGYEVFAISEDLPPGYKNFSMKKSLIKL